jgi:hypothetical protein
LENIEGSHFPTSTQEIGGYRSYRFGDFDDITTKVLGKQGLGEVVLGGAKASGNQDQVSSLGSLFKSG